MLEKLQPGAIILMHVGGKATAGILPTLIEDLRSRGYGFVDLRTALGAGRLLARSVSPADAARPPGSRGSDARQAYRCSSHGSPSAW